jgi:hypothetical protein
MLERALILIGLAVLVVVIWRLVALWRTRQVRRLRAARPLAGLVPAGRPAVVAFSTPACAECRSRQAPALARLALSAGDAVTVRTLSVLEHPRLVRQVGILTVPATVVVDAAGRVRYLNLGFAAETTLREQLASVMQSA